MLCLFICNIIRFYINVDEKYYPQKFLEEYKYAVKKKKINAINKELNLDGYDDYDEFDRSRK